MTTRQKALRNLGFAVLLMIAMLLFMRWTDAHFHARTPAQSERMEAWREQNAEDARAKNYVENIKPNLAR